jgi:hypothetical protein
MKEKLWKINMITARYEPWHLLTFDFLNDVVKRGVHGEERGMKLYFVIKFCRGFLKGSFTKDLFRVEFT